MPASAPIPRDGFIRTWLALGPFTGNPAGLLTTSLIDEERVVPRRGARLNGRVWTAIASEGPDVNFMQLCPKWPAHSNCCAYVLAYIHAPKTTAGYLALGSDDGIAAWLNGVPLVSIDATRACIPDQDLIPVTLPAGWSRLLMKVTQYGGGWQCIARFLRMDQTVLTGLRCATTPPPAGQAAWETANTMPASVTAVPPEVSTTENMSASSVLSFAVKVYNSQRAALSGLIVRVADADGACVREQRCEPIPPRQHRMVELSLPVRVWARSFGPGLRIQAFTGDTAVSEPVMLMPGVTDTLRLLAIDLPVELAAGEAATLQQLINDVGVDGQLAAVYPAIRSSLEMVATALISGDHAAARAALAEADNLVIAQQQRIAGQCVHLAGHGHIDMNWLWQWPETVQACRDTFRQALRFMDEFPEFSFNQSQASCYEAMEREAPEVFAAIAKAVANGRWEIVGGMWTEGDTNLSSGEALARSFLLAQRYFIEKLGVRSRTGWLPDNFGHIAQLPQLLRLAGINAFYHMRCGPWEGAQLYWWEAPDGSRVLAKTGQGYGETVTPSIRTQPLKLPKSVPQQMFVYGVGDHGGGPTRKDIMTAKRCARSRLFPAVKFSTAGQYFDTVRPLSAGLRTHKGELQFTLQGCYTSVAAVKRANRALENALQSAEALAAAAGMLGMEWPATALGAAWKTLVFNQFHDILPGSAIHESNRDSIARYTVALERAAEVKTAALRWIGDRVRCARQDGAPFIVFNPLAWRRSDVVTAELVVTEQFSGIRVFDPAGDELPVHIVKTKQFDADIHVWIRFFAKDVPGVGYKVFTARFDAGTPPVPVLHWGSPYATLPCRALSAHEQSLKTVTHRKGIVSNRFFDLAFDRKTGAIRRLQMKSGKTSGRNLAGRKGLNTLAMYIESARHCSGWILDNAARGPLPLEVTRPATIVEDSAECVSWRASFAWGASTFRMTTTVHAGSPRIDTVLEADWLERGRSPKRRASSASDIPDTAALEGSPTSTIECPMLRALFDFSRAPKSLVCDTPFAAVARKPGIEAPAQRWADVPLQGGGVALLNDSKYGHSLDRTTLRLGLLRSFINPDQLPDVGRHTIRWALLPHRGGWLEAGVAREGFAFNVPFETWQVREQEGVIGDAHSFLETGGDAGFIVTGVKRAEDGDGLIVRGYDASGRGSEASIAGHTAFTAAAETDILEEPHDAAGNAIACQNGVARIIARPSAIVTMRLKA